jgi:2,5-furandicarboxylate decarboxylase 1
MQQSLPDFVAAMEKAGFLVRVKEEIRVDQIPKFMEANPTKAVLIEKVRDSEFAVLANAYSNRTCSPGPWAATRPAPASRWSRAPRVG